MTIRTKQELKEQVATLLPDNTDGDISAADVRTNLIDMIDTLASLVALNALIARVVALEADEGQPVSHSLYAGWSDDRVIAADDLVTASDADDISIEIPARVGAGYLFIATLATNGMPSSLTIDGGRNQIGAFPPQAGTVDDPASVAHLVFISSRQQAPAIAGLTLTIDY